jgi:hypothetical protein
MATENPVRAAYEAYVRGELTLDEVERVADEVYERLIAPLFARSGPPEA